MKLKTWQTLTVVVVLLVVGCGAVATPAEDGSILPATHNPAASQAVEPAQEPNLEDNHQVDTQSQRIDELEARLTTLQKMERDYMAEQLLTEADAIAREISKGGTTRDYYQEIVRLYVPVYMADICIKGSQPFAQGFTAITRANLSAGRGAEVEALRVIKALGAVGDTDTQQCLQPYLHPESISDASPAIDLYLAAITSVSSPFRGSFKSVVGGMAAGWFQTDRQEPFIPWLCQQSNDTPCGL